MRSLCPFNKQILWVLIKCEAYAPLTNKCKHLRNCHTPNSLPVNNSDLIHKYIRTFDSLKLPDIQIQLNIKYQKYTKYKIFEMRIKPRSLNMSKVNICKMRIKPRSLKCKQSRNLWKANKTEIFKCEQNRDLWNANKFGMWIKSRSLKCEQIWNVNKDKIFGNVYVKDVKFFEKWVRWLIIQTNCGEKGL